MESDTVVAIAASIGLVVCGIAWAASVRRLRAEAARLNERLRQAEAETDATTRAILEAAVDGIVTIDTRGNIATFNRAAEKIFGYRAEEVANKNVSILMPEPYRSAHDGYINNYLSSGIPRIIGIGREVVGLRRDGSTFPMDLAVGESRVGNRRIFAGIIRDITDRKQTEDRLRQSEERFRLLVEGVRDYSIVTLDIDGRISSWNKGAERLEGWREEEIVGRPFSCFFLPEDVRAGVPEAVLESLRTHHRFEAEGWRQRKDGSRFWANVVMTTMRDGPDNIRGYVRIARDMTDRKAAEEALRRAKEEAERANLAKSKFLAAASHDLRQPVQALYFFASALDRRLRDHPARTVLVDLGRSLESLNLLLDSLLDVSKLDAGIVTPNVTTFSVASLLDRMDTEFGEQARAKHVDLRVVPSNLIIRSDPSLLHRIVQNLVANAVRYTPSGRILVGCRRRGNSVRIDVIDTGIGIPEERLEEIFQEFYQVGNQERDRAQGLGLGLSIVERLARLLGHTVTVRSRIGHGSRFSVEVPISEEARPKAVKRSAGALAAARLIVIIDDEPAVLRGLGLILEEWGFEVLAATSEAEAMDLLERLGRRPAAIVADYRLRDGQTGTDAIAHIRDRFRTVIPSIIITGGTGSERLREVEASGLSILHKPVQPPLLHTLLTQSMGNA